MNNVKPGDLAYVLHSANDDKATGMVVEVLRDSPHWTEHFGVQCWLCRAKSEIPCQSAATGEITSAKEVVFGDYRLRPIGGVPLTDDVTDDIKEPA